MSEKKYQRCVRCVMDTTDSEITFDAQGHCNHCTDFFILREELTKNRHVDAAHLNSLVAKIKTKSKNKKYDVVLGISGGVDSCYVAYLLHQLGLRTLLVHMDNGWNSDHAVGNIKKVATKLGFDYESYVLDWEEFKDLQLSFLKASVIEAETPTDIAIQGALHIVAARYGVKYIMSGGNLASEGILPRTWHYNAKDTRYLHDIQKHFSKKLIKKLPLFGYQQEIFYKFAKGIRIIYLLNYISYHKEKAREILKAEMGWTSYGGKHHESRFTKFVQSYMLPKKFNLDYRLATLSSEICAGEITREEALKQLALPSYVPEEIEVEKAYISKKLGITVQELEDIVNLPAKSYRHYANDEKLLGVLYKLYKKYFYKLSSV